MKVKDTSFTKYKHSFSGELEIHFDPSVQKYLICIQDDRGVEFLHSGEKDAPLSVYKRMDWKLFLSSSSIYYIRIFKNGNIEFEGFISNSFKKLNRHNFEYSYLPEQIDTAKWILWCDEGLYAELFSNESPPVMKSMEV